MKEKLILVLDDYHVIEATAVYQALTFLLEQLPPQLHLVITSRANPPLPLARLRGRLTFTHKCLPLPTSSRIREERR